jgi:hypothetical protein
MSQDFKSSQSGHPWDASREGAYILKVVLTPAEVIDRLKANIDAEGSASALDPKKPFYGRVSTSKFRVQSKQLDRPKWRSPLLSGRLSLCADGCEIFFTIRGPAGFPVGVLVLGALWGFIVGIAVACCLTSDPQSGAGYLVFSGLFALGALALWLAGRASQEQLKIEFVTLFEKEAFRKRLPHRKRSFPPDRSEVVSTMLRKPKPSRPQLLHRIRTCFLVSFLALGIPFLAGLLYAWPPLLQLGAELETLRALQAADLEAIAIYPDEHAKEPLVTVTDEAHLHELCGKFDRIERAARVRSSRYTQSFYAVFRYRNGTSQNWEIRVKKEDNHLYLNRPAGEELSSFRLSSSYYQVPQSRSWLEKVTDSKRPSAARHPSGWLCSAFRVRSETNQGKSASRIRNGNNGRSLRTS